MAILTVEIVKMSGWSRPRDLARKIADAVAEVLHAAPQSVWVRISTIAAGDYSENLGVPVEAAPIFVSILEKSPPEEGALAMEVAALTGAIAEACRRKTDDIHLIYEPPGRGRVASGGNLIS
jgi:phenylpyruvate tautomerase PptA (4-oxalocrotonate tautomerase family)